MSMHLLLYTISVCSFLLGSALMLVAKSVFHEQLAGFLFIISAVFFCAAPIVQLLERISERLDEPEDD